MKKQIVSLTWLPPAEDWDFRSVREAECRIACYWEYARDMRPVTIAGALPARLVGDKRGSFARPSPKTDVDVSGWTKRDPVTKSALFPQAWLSLTEAERSGIIGSVEPLRALRVRTLQDEVEKAKWALVEDTAQARRYRDGTYVVQPNFSRFGVEAVIRAFKVWARREARKYAQAPRAKAAELPFDLMKWLAVYRLEERRREAGITYEVAQGSLRAYRGKKTGLDPNAVFPAYATHGAWSKARTDAAKIRRDVAQDQYFLLKDWYAIG